MPITPPTFGNFHDYLAHRAQWISDRDSDPAKLPDAAQWEAERPAIHKRLMKSLGLDPFPRRCELSPQVMGTFTGQGFTATKVAYQILPDCWGSAHFYRPSDVEPDELTPAVLYTCGHSPSGVIGYQQYAIAWARRGYSVLIFDTIEQHDNPGDHHGLNRGRTPEWIAKGFSGAGGEVFNGIRALDLLLSQPGVDADRVGVTGLSGGGSQSFHLAVADDRLKAVATLCGVSHYPYAIGNHLVHQHCDCMYPRNLFSHDASVWASLIAPRALMYCFAGHDQLFTAEEYHDLYERTHARFDKLGHGDKCKLYEFDGPHGYNHADTAHAIHDWFDLHVAGKEQPRVDAMAIKANGETNDEPSLSVFHGTPPQPNHLALLPDLMTPNHVVPLPDSPDHWPAIKQTAIQRLRDECFASLDDVEHSQQIEPYANWLAGTNHRDAWRGQLDGMSQHLMQLTPADNDHEYVIVAINGRDTPALKTCGQTWELGEPYAFSALGVEPRAAGHTAFREDQRTRLQREGCLMGLTPTMAMVQDLHHLWPHLLELPRVKDRKVILYGKGEGAVAMLFHALLNPHDNVAAVVLEDLPTSFNESAWQIMSVLRVMDIQQAIALLAPTPVALVNWNTYLSGSYLLPRLAGRLGSPAPINTDNPVDAFTRLARQLNAPFREVSPHD